MCRSCTATTLGDDYWDPDERMLPASAVRSSTACELMSLEGDWLAAVILVFPEGEGLGDGIDLLTVECLLCVPTTSFLGEASGEGADLGSIMISSASTAVRFIFKPSSRASFSPASIAPCSFLFLVFASYRAIAAWLIPTLATLMHAGRAHGYDHALPRTCV